MNFSGLHYLASIVLALAGYIIVYFAAPTLSSPVAIALGILVGGIIIPLIPNMLGGSQDQQQNTSSD